MMRSLFTHGANRVYNIPTRRTHHREFKPTPRRHVTRNRGKKNRADKQLEYRIAQTNLKISQMRNNLLKDMLFKRFVAKDNNARQVTVQLDEALRSLAVKDFTYYSRKFLTSGVGPDIKNIQRVINNSIDTSRSNQMREFFREITEWILTNSDRITISVVDGLNIFGIVSQLGEPQKIPDGSIIIFRNITQKYFFKLSKLYNTCLFVIIDPFSPKFTESFDNCLQKISGSVDDYVLLLIHRMFPIRTSIITNDKLRDKNILKVFFKQVQITLTCIHPNKKSITFVIGG
jgi:hypothetical protein